MLRGRQLYIDTKSFIQEFSKVVDKLDNTIRYDRFEKAMKLPNVMHKKIH